MEQAIEAAQAAMSHRDQIRAHFFAQKPKTRVITLECGLNIELREPTVGKQLDLADVKDPKQRMVRMLIEHAYVAGTGERLFDEADFDGIVAAPAGGDYTKMLEALTSLIQVKEEVKEQGKS